MYALVQFLVNKIKAIVPVKNIKDFNPVSFDTDLSRSYEVFWKSPNGTNCYYAVVYLVAETEELVEQRSKRLQFPPGKRLDDLLAITLEAKQSMGYKRVQQRDKEVQETQSVGDEGTLKEISNNHKLTEKRRRSPSQSSDKNRKRVSTAIVQRRGSSPSPSKISDGDDFVLKSELEKMTTEYKKVLHKLKLKKEKIAQLKKKNDQLQEINMSFQTQLLSMLSANNSFLQNPPPIQRLPESVNVVSDNLPKERIENNKKGSLLQNPPPIQRLPELVNIVSDNLPKERIENNKRIRLEENPHPAQKIVRSIGIVTDDLAKERVENNEGGNLEENPHPTQKITRSIGIVTDNLAIERVENNDGGNLEENPPPTQKITRSIGIVTDNLPEKEAENNDRDTEEKLTEALSSRELRKNVRKTRTSVRSIGKKRTIDDIQKNLVEETDEDTDDSLISKRAHDAEMDSLRSELIESERKYTTLKEKYKQLQGRFDNVYDLNISLQERLNTTDKLNSQESVLNEITNSSSVKRISPKSLSLATNNSSVKPVSSASSENASIATSDSQNNTPPPSIMSENVTSNLSLTSHLFQNEDQPPATVPDSGQEIPAREYHLSQEKMKLIFQSAKPGVHGDSLFVKKLAVAIYGESVLSTSSVTGQKSNRKKESIAKPQLCPERLLYIKGLFRQKVASESADKKEIEKRIKKMNYFLAEKIATILRYKSDSKI